MVLEINPNDFDTLYEKGIALAKLGKDEEAIVCFDKSGIALAKLGKDEEAIVCFDKALEINPNHRKTFSWAIVLERKCQTCKKPLGDSPLTYCSSKCRFEYYLKPKK